MNQMNSIIKNFQAGKNLQNIALVKLCIVCTFCLFASVLHAQTTEKIAWDYPIKPGTEQWRQFKSMEEMYQACQIPDNLLKKLDTESLTDICLNYPAPPTFLVFDTPQQAFMAYYFNFNGIQELYKRKDAGHYLLKKYATMSFSDFNPLWPLHQQGQFVSHYKFVETILAQPQIISSLDAKDRKSLLRETISKMDEKLEKNDLFGGFSIEINLWTVLVSFHSQNKSLLREYDQQNLQTAIETGMFVDIDADMLYQQAKKYAYENE